MQDKNTVKAVSSSEFSIAHYTGRVIYTVKEIPEKNRDFLPPEITESLRSSNNAIMRSLFTNKIDKLGTLNVSLDDKAPIKRRNISSSSSSDEEKVHITYLNTFKLDVKQTSSFTA